MKVAPGHFRNHLMPKLLAVPNIEKYAYLVREQRKVLFCCTDTPYYILMHLNLWLGWNVLVFMQSDGNYILLA